MSNDDKHPARTSNVNGTSPGDRHACRMWRGRASLSGLGSPGGIAGGMRRSPPRSCARAPIDACGCDTD
eukprot:1947150-Prymnesium_polylepis.1